MAALEMLTGCEEGLLSLREEGGQVGCELLGAALVFSAQAARLQHTFGCLLPLLQAALESYLAGVQRTPATEDAVYRAQRLLDALQRLGDL